MSATDFSDRPFVAGSLVGVRAFDVDSLGRLKIPTFSHVFTPGVNQANCSHDGPLGSLMRAQQDAVAFMLGRAPAVGKMNLDGTRSSEPVPHTLAGLGCDCGFYAYFDGGNDYRSYNRVTAVVEGTGTCTVGSRGFRSAKMRILALVIPPLPKPGLSWRERILLAMHSLIAVWMLAVVVVQGIDRDWTQVAIFTALAAGNAYVVRATWKQRARKRIAQPVRRYDADLVRRNYPDVPVYPDLASALADHPLTPPEVEVITPETHHDFWTRKAR